MQVWVIGTTRNEADLVEVFVRHHLDQGVDQFVLLDNDSSDGTPDLLSDLSRAYPVRWRRHAGAFLQPHLLSLLAEEARVGGADWILPVDADEFWVGREKRLRDILADSTADALGVEVVNFIQRREQRHTTPATLLTMACRTPAPVGPVHRGEELVDTGQIAYVEHVYDPKWAFRARPDLRISWGNHSSGDLKLRREPGVGLQCLHAPLRSLAVLEAKGEGDRPYGAIEQYFDMAWHLRRWRRLAIEDRLESEWAANSYAQGHLEVYGHLHPVITDTRLRDAVAPWLPPAHAPTTA